MISLPISFQRSSVHCRLIDAGRAECRLEMEGDCITSSNAQSSLLHGLDPIHSLRELCNFAYSLLSIHIFHDAFS